MSQQRRVPDFADLLIFADFDHYSLYVVIYPVRLNLTMIIRFFSHLNGVSLPRPTTLGW